MDQCHAKGASVQVQVGKSLQQEAMLNRRRLECLGGTLGREAAREGKISFCMADPSDRHSVMLETHMPTAREEHADQYRSIELDAFHGDVHRFLMVTRCREYLSSGEKRAVDVIVYVRVWAAMRPTSRLAYPGGRSWSGRRTRRPSSGCTGACHPGRRCRVAHKISVVICSIQTAPRETHEYIKCMVRKVVEVVKNERKVRAASPLGASVGALARGVCPI